MGSVDPAGDFRTLIKQKSLLFGEGEVQFFCGVINILSGCIINHHDSRSALAIVLILCLVAVTLVSFPVCQQLTQRIEQLLSNKNTQYYMKSITCIQAFREQSVKVNKHSLSLPCGKYMVMCGTFCYKSLWEIMLRY